MKKINLWISVLVLCVPMGATANGSNLGLRLK